MLVCQVKAITSPGKAQIYWKFPSLSTSYNSGEQKKETNVLSIFINNCCRYYKVTENYWKSGFTKKTQIMLNGLYKHKQRDPVNSLFVQKLDFYVKASLYKT